MSEQRQELHCTNCGLTVRFTMDFGLDGNHEITCPKCGHVHYRVVVNGQITEERWNSSYTIYYVSAVSTASSWGWATYGGNSTATGTASVGFLYDSWSQFS